MRRIAIALAVPAIAVAVLAASASGRPAATFKWCTDPTFPPMEYTTTSGKIVGFDVDMAAALAKTWGGTSSASKTAFPGLIPALNAKKCSAVISGIFITPDRTKQAGVVSYMHTHRVLIVKAGNPKKIHSPNQLKGLVVAVQTGTKYEEYLKALKAKIGFTLQSYPGDNDAVAQVLHRSRRRRPHAGHVVRVPGEGAPGKIAVGFTFAASDQFGIYFRKADAATLGAQIKDGVARLRVDRHSGQARGEVQDPGQYRQVVVASFDSHLFWSALTSGPYWRGALTALELTAVSLGDRAPDRLLRRARRTEPSAVGPLGIVDLQLVVPRDADAAPALFRLGRAADALERLRAIVVHAVHGCVDRAVAQRSRVSVGDHPFRPDVRRPGPGARGPRARDVGPADPAADRRAPGDPHRDSADRERVHHAPEADVARVDHLAARAADAPRTSSRPRSSSTPSRCSQRSCTTS